MHKWIVVAAIAASCLASPAAQAMEPSRPYQQVAANHWSYAAVARLEKHGYMTGSPAGAFGGSRKLTRYAFATAVERMYRSLQPRVLSATKPGQLSADLRTFRRLLDEFAGEIATLGPDVAEMKRQFEALEQRVARLEKEASPLENRRVAGGFPADAFLPNRSYGIRSALAGSLLADTPSAVTGPSLEASGFQPGLAAAAGPLSFGVSLNGPDRLTSMQDLPLENPIDALNYRGELSLALSKYTLRAFYGRQNDLWDRFGETPFSQLGASTTLGYGVSGPISDRLGFEFDAATTTAEDRDMLARVLSFRGGLNYNLGPFTFGLDYERSRFGAAGNALNFNVYGISVGRSFGNTKFDLLLRHSLMSGGVGSTTGGDGSSSAITQISVKF